MNVKEIVKKTMDKLHKHLNDMHNDVMNPNIFNLDNKIFGNELTKINKKYTDFIESKTTQQNVKEYITDIYNKKKTNTVTYIENKGY
jgi:predicted metal-dependent hydrolase